MNGEDVSGIRERAPGAAQPPLVLIVEDRPDVQCTYGLCVRRAGYRVAFASSGEEATAKARALHPEAMIMDLFLRGSDGWAAARAIRDDPSLDGVCILAISGAAEPKIERLAYESGCDLFVSKACPIEGLLSILHGLIARKEVTFVSGTRLRAAREHHEHEHHDLEVPSQPTG
jgi:CheY-like chemotaxis protein